MPFKIDHHNVSDLTLLEKIIGRIRLLVHRCTSSDFILLRSFLADCCSDIIVTPDIYLGSLSDFIT